MGYQGEKSYITSVEVHPQLSHNGHPVDGWCAGGCWFTLGSYEHGFLSHLGTSKRGKGATFSIGKIGVERAHIIFGLIEYQTN